MGAYKTRNILVGLLIFLGVGALFGGSTLVLSPSGTLLGLPINLLKNAPFDNYLIPGIILFTVLGLAPIWVAYGLLKFKPNSWAEGLNVYRDMHWAWTFSIYIAFALIVWIQVEMYFLQVVHWSHLFYMIVAMAIIFVLLLPENRKLYTNIY